jgi:hypothetical protein
MVERADDVHHDRRGMQASPGDLEPAPALLGRYHVHERQRFRAGELAVHLPDRRRHAPRSDEASIAASSRLP